MKERQEPTMIPEMHGGYLWAKNEEEIAEVKKQMIENMKAVIDEAAQREDFWIVKDGEGGAKSVAWKIAFPTLLHPCGGISVVKIKEDGTKEVIKHFNL